MPMPHTVKVNPAVLEWARRTAGMSQFQAANALRIPDNQLAALEAGREMPSRTLLQRMARAYKRAYIVMLLPEPPVLEDIPTDYRTLPGPRQAIGPDTAYALRAARRLQEAITDIVEEDPSLLQPFETLQTSIDQNAEGVGIRFRASLDVTLQEQTGWSDYDVAFRAWRGALQSFGVIVLVEDMPRDECRGFSLWNPHLVPTIVVTRNEHPSAQVFTLFHEVGHHLLRSDAMCLKQEDDSLRGTIETWCNRFAAAVLIPAADLEAFLDAHGFDGYRDWPIDVLARVARHFRVSRHVLAIRLEDLKKVPPGYYRRIVRLMVNDDVRPIGPRKREGTGIQRNMARERLTEVGFVTANVILRACKSELLSTSEAADLLRLRPRTFSRLEEYASEQQARYG